ncbi:hypothetical protein EJ02DRAFT_426929 [Clathrospora elynae]|uniref:Uncharacterized protein n=1 Tax=Clathrospora elynae TaxID=706981 RepID=A0A6A5SAQ1_9PLEO|nr:hypothetical protein EJ02DRAFT_426929 [Clathrospora elynae]
MDYATRVATEESGTAKEHHSAAHFLPSNKASDPKENSYDLTASKEGDYVSQRGNLGAAVERAFSIGGIESPCHERSLETFFGIIDVTNGLSTTRKRSRQSLNIDSTTFPLAAVPSFIPDLEREVPYPAKRQRLAEQQAQSPILEPASTPNSTPLLDLSAGDGPIPSPLGAGRKGDGAMSRVLPRTDLRDVEDGDDAYVQGAVEELLHARRSSPPSEGMEGEQDGSVL